MKRLLYVAFIVCFVSTAYAGTWDAFHTYTTTDTVTSARLNGNINNGRTVVNGGLDNTNADTSSGFRFYEALGSLPSAGTLGRLVFETASHYIAVDDGSAFTNLTALVRDADKDTMVQVEEASDEDIIRFDTGGTEQIWIEDGIVRPTLDDDVDLGTSSAEFKNIYSDGTITCDQIDMDRGAGADAINIVTEGTANHGIYVNQNAILDADKHGLYVYSNSDQDNDALVHVKSDNAASDEEALRVTSDSSTFYAMSVNGAFGGIEINNAGAGDSIIDDSGAKLTAAGVWTDAPCTWDKKDNVTELKVDGFIDKIDGLKLYEYRKKSEVAVLGDAAPVHYGYILDDTSTPDELKTFNSDGNVDPEAGMSAQRGVSFLLAVNKELADKVAELERRIADIESN